MQIRGRKSNRNLVDSRLNPFAAKVVHRASRSGVRFTENFDLLVRFLVLLIVDHSCSFVEEIVD